MIIKAFPKIALLLVVGLFVPTAVFADVNSGYPVPDFTWSYGNSSPDYTYSYGNGGPDYSYSYGNSPDYTYSYSNSPDYTWSYNNTPDYTWSYNNTPDYTWSYNNTPDYTWSYDTGCGYGCAQDFWYPPVDYGCSYDCYTPTYSYNDYQYDYSSYDYSYDYNYNYDYNYDYHTCAEMGQIGTYPNCHYPREPEPVCAISASDSSIDEGDSTTLHWTSENASSATLSSFGSVSTGGSRSVSPDNDTTYTLTVFGSTGGKDTCSTTVHVKEKHSNNNLSCDLNVSDTRVSEGDRVTLDWDTSGDVTYASINQGVGRVDEDGGSERVTIDDDTTFRMTVRDEDGEEDTCSVTVRIEDDNNNDFSSVTFYGEPTNNPPTVYLSSLPYTGLEDITPSMWAFYLMLIAGAGVLGYFFFIKSMPFAFAVGGTSAPETESATETTDMSGAVTDFVEALETGNHDAVVDHLRTAAVTGTGVEEFIAQAHAVVSDETLASRLASALEAAKETGIRGAKAVLTA